MPESAEFGVSKDAAPFCVKDAPGRVPEHGAAAAEPEALSVDGAHSSRWPCVFVMGGANLPILQLAQLWQDLQQFRISLDELGDVLDAPAEPARRSGRAALPAIAGEVRFEHVTFCYRPEAPEVLRDVSLRIARGSVVGIVGRSGSGMSTLVKLVQRFYVPERGRVLVGGVDLALADPAWLRRQIGVVLQENVLFDWTARDNIAFSDPAMPMARVVAAARLAGGMSSFWRCPKVTTRRWGSAGRRCRAGSGSA